DFLKTGGHWRKGLIWREVVKRHKGISRGVRKWLTRAQMISHFGDETTADAVITRKASLPELADEIRDHPELPGLKQYLILVEDEEVQEEEDLVTDLFRTQDAGSKSDSSSSS
ncbi:unnamed protein product, partial [Durusdinium trenchii]